MSGLMGVRAALTSTDNVGAAECAQRVATAIEMPGQAMTEAAGWCRAVTARDWQRDGVIPLIHRQLGVSYSIQIQESARLNVAKAGRAHMSRSPEPQGAPCVYAYKRPRPCPQT